MTSPHARLRHAGHGVLATLVGLALAHLVAAATTIDASPVLAVGATVIDLTPTPVKEWAVATFGTADKAVLVGSVVVVVLLVAALAGVVAARRTTSGVVVLVATAALAVLAALSRPGAVATDALPGLVAAVTGGATLAWLHRLDPLGGPGPTDAPAEEGAASPSRRGVLQASAGLAALAVVAGGAGRWLAAQRQRLADIVLPAAADPAPPLPTGLEERFPGISSFRTANPVFYRIDTRLSLPVVDERDWTLRVDGDVDRQLELSFEDLLAMDLVERDITLTCVSNEVGGPYVGSARWLGVPVTDLLDRAGIDGTRADQVLSTDVDGMTISTPLAALTDGRDALLAVGMNGEPLPLSHGFPARMVVSGLYGFISACKWIDRITLTTYADRTAYWTRRGWATHAPIKLSSRIDTPASLSTVEAGDRILGGVAWAQDRGVAKVEVRIDGGPWQPVRLGPSAGEDYWRQWWFPWRAQPGRHFLASRVTDKDGTVQTAVRATPFPDGASGIQEINVNVV